MSVRADVRLGSCLDWSTNFLLIAMASTVRSFLLLVCFQSLQKIRCIQILGVFGFHSLFRGTSATSVAVQA